MKSAWTMSTKASAKIDKIELPESFFGASLEVRKPSFSQKAKLAELQQVAFQQVKTSDYVPGMKRLIQATASSVECEDFSEDLKPNMSHPWFWRALGFYSEEPMVNFNYYSEPKGGKGEGEVVGLEGTKESNKRQVPNAYPDIPLNPLSSRFGGGLLALQCVVHFFEAPLSKKVASCILKKRRQKHVQNSTEHYMFIVVAMEITRVLALTYSLVHTREQETPKFPIQPDSRCLVPFEVDWQDISHVRVYPYRSFWAFVCEKNGFERLFACAYLVYETMYSQMGCSIADTYKVVQDTDNFMQDCLGKCKSLKELESTIFDLLAADVVVSSNEAVVASPPTENKEEKEEIVTHEVEEAGLGADSD